MMLMQVRELRFRSWVKIGGLYLMRPHGNIRDWDLRCKEAEEHPLLRFHPAAWVLSMLKGYHVGKRKDGN
jgi:hypothetical protein